MEHSRARRGRQLVTAEATKRLAVTDRATGLIEVHFPRAVGRHKSFDVTGRLEVNAADVALVTTERIIDLVVADDTIRHPRHICRRDVIAFSKTAMACLTGSDGSFELVANIAGRLKVIAIVDGRRDHRRQIAHFQMLLVAEMSHPGGRRTTDRCRRMASQTDLGVRKQVVARLCASSRRDMAVRAFELLLEMDLMRKRRGIRGRAPDRNAQQKDPHP